MLIIDLGQLREGPVETTGAIQPDSPALQGLDLVLAEPVVVAGRLQETGEGEYYWHATLRGAVREECRRCLTEVLVPFDVELRVLFSRDPETAEDPGVYLLDPGAVQVDLRAAVVEEVALAVPSFVLCREECAGLCVQCGADLNAGPCSCSDPAVTV